MVDVALQFVIESLRLLDDSLAPFGTPSASLGLASTASSTPATAFQLFPSLFRQVVTSNSSNAYTSRWSRESHFSTCEKHEW